MGIYLNPNNWGFKESVQSEIYVDKSKLMKYTNKVLGTEQKNICVSRPRRFGKSMAAKMLAAYYSKGSNSAAIFDELKISEDESYREHLNQHNVVFINMQNFLSDTHNASLMIEKITAKIGHELKKKYSDVEYMEGSSLPEMFDQIFAETEERFVFIIDEWDCIFREKKENEDGQILYLDFLRNLLKDKYYVSLAYMTGILPIKKYGSHSALNMFDEYSMTDPGQMAEFVGFTESEVEALCRRYEMDFAEVRRWYDGYQVADEAHVYNPRSVVAAMLSGRFSNYWSKTENYEALKVYIEMDFDGLKKTIVELLAGGRTQVNPFTFQNDMTSFQSRDDVLTLLIHLGYLGYDEEKQEVFVPNYEVSMEFVNALQGVQHGK